MKIVLLGYMASGKSTVGKVLAEKLDLPFIDLDNYIEEKYTKSISVIFKEEGEIYFRLQEHEAIKEILENKEHFVLSLGGGTPCYANNMTLINSYNDLVSIYIKVSIKTIYNRLLSEKEHRPLVARIPEEELEEFIAKHLFERSYFYEQAKLRIKTDSKDLTETVNEIKDRLTILEKQ
ncbi:shikimate kinase [Tenacibaculum sp. MEBiC06402]|uniref:shikimate kinase n=1 Tax=unclassified Tenacibaculum TaxID=2635139 RepID=UPI003B9C33DE